MEESLLQKNLNDEISLITSILQNLKPPQQNANEKMFNLIKLENTIDEINVDSNSNLNILEKSIEYLVNNILSTTNFTKVEFRYSELLTNFIEDERLKLSGLIFGEVWIRPSDLKSEIIANDLEESLSIHLSQRANKRYMF